MPPPHADLIWPDSTFNISTFIFNFTVYKYFRNVKREIGEGRDRVRKGNRFLCSLVARTKSGSGTGSCSLVDPY
jgi:hypothetical protein